ncbi:hypothetical protein BB558_004299 [Smittium angustum]|uniref:G-patch domain-containing protein n=1 Tax=Smittium angustum TaxID=133377 RepID=A0A2U1J3Q2_SMIAN|nr:hypothetical protein BB558_004299 [Smittium angustum]
MNENIQSPSILNPQTEDDTVEAKLEKLKQEIKGLENHDFNQFPTEYNNTNIEGIDFVPSEDPRYWYNQESAIWYDTLDQTYSYYDSANQVYVPLEYSWGVEEPEDLCDSNLGEILIRMVVKDSQARNVHAGRVYELNDEVYIGRDKSTKFENYLRLEDINTSKCHAHLYTKEKYTRKRNYPKHRDHPESQLENEFEYDPQHHKDRKRTEYQYESNESTSRTRSRNKSNSHERRDRRTHDTDNGRDVERPKYGGRSGNKNFGKSKDKETRDLNKSGKGPNDTQLEDHRDHRRNQHKQQRGLPGSPNQEEIDREKSSDLFSNPNYLEIPPEKQLYIVDFGSTQGTFLNGSRLSKTKEASRPYELNHNDTLSIGCTVFSIHIHKGLPCSECSLAKTEISAEPIPEVHVDVQKTNGETKSIVTQSIEFNRKNEMKRMKNKYKLNVKAYNETSGYVDRAAVRANMMQHYPNMYKTQQFGAELDNQQHTSNENKNKVIDGGNIGFQMLAKMGWSQGKGLGASEKGISEPVLALKNEGRFGLGTGFTAPVSENSKEIKKQMKNSERMYITQQRYNKSQE